VSPGFGRRSEPRFSNSPKSAPSTVFRLTMEQLRVNSALLARTSLPPAADTIHLVMDNLSSHSRKAVVERYGEKAGGWLWDRFTVHYTPTHGSWLNQAEIEISLFSRQCLGQRRIASLRDLRREARAWNRRINRDGVTIDWQFTRRKARAKFGYKSTNIMWSRT
jgi:transposase